MLNIKKAIDSLVEKGWYIQPDFLDQEKVRILADLCKGRTLTRSSIGKLKTINESIRNDNISWLIENEKDEPILDCQNKLKEISNCLNENLYLGLNNVECHFAQYEKGSFYKAHKDSFKNDDKRTITVITYLNEDWKEGDGGELRLHLSKGNIDVQPHGGTMICFISNEIVHEVLESNKERLSLTGWLLK